MHGDFFGCFGSGVDECTAITLIVVFRVRCELLHGDFFVCVLGWLQRIFNAHRFYIWDTVLDSSIRLTGRS